MSITLLIMNNSGNECIMIDEDKNIWNSQRSILRKSLLSNDKNNKFRINFEKKIQDIEMNQKELDVFQETEVVDNKL